MILNYPYVVEYLGVAMPLKYKMVKRYDASVLPTTPFLGPFYVSLTAKPTPSVVDRIVFYIDYKRFDVLPPFTPEMAQGLKRHLLPVEMTIPITSPITRRWNILMTPQCMDCRKKALVQMTWICDEKYLHNFDHQMIVGEETATTVIPFKVSERKLLRSIAFESVQ